MELRIDGLTNKQIQMLQHIWSYDDKDTFLVWFETLSYKDKRMVEGLLELIRLEVMENDLDEEDMSEANTVIEQIRRK